MPITKTLDRSMHTPLPLLPIGVTSGPSGIIFGWRLDNVKKVNKIARWRSGVHVCLTPQFRVRISAQAWATELKDTGATRFQLPPLPLRSNGWVSGVPAHPHQVQKLRDPNNYYYKFVIRVRLAARVNLRLAHRWVDFDASAHQ